MPLELVGWEKGKWIVWAHAVRTMGGGGLPPTRTGHKGIAAQAFLAALYVEFTTKTKEKTR